MPLQASPSKATGRKQSPTARPVTAGPDPNTLAPGGRTLHRDLRADVYRLYHVLRTVDDAVDEDWPDAPQLLEALEHWVADEPVDTPETRVLTDLWGRYELSRGLLAGLCAAMQHDIAGGAIETEDDLERYCQGTGGTVAVVLAQMIGTVGRDDEVRMAILGRAFQRTNILRDIDEDLAHGRIYIARSTIQRFGFPSPGAREALLRDQIARAETLYDQVRSAMPRLCQGQRGLELTTALYREILRQIEREGYGRRPGCVVVPTWRRRLLIAKHRLRFA